MAAASEALLPARRHPGECRKAGRVRGRIGDEEEGERENQPGIVGAGLLRPQCCKTSSPNPRLEYTLLEGEPGRGTLELSVVLKFLAPGLWLRMGACSTMRPLPENRSSLPLEAV